MARDIFVNGETLVSVKGPAGGPLANTQELGLATGPITLTEQFAQDDIQCNAWGDKVPMDIQTFLLEASITMSLVHFDPAILDACVRYAVGGASTAGLCTNAGARIGGGKAQFAAGNTFIGMILTSQVASKPWRFHYCFLAQNPVSWPLGTERSVVSLTWRSIPYTTDPWNSGLGALGATVWDNVSTSW